MFGFGKKLTNSFKQDPFEQLVINQETDIVSIIGGLQCIINTCLGIKIDIKMTEQDDEDVNEAERLNREK